MPVNVLGVGSYRSASRAIFVTLLPQVLFQQRAIPLTVDTLGVVAARSVAASSRDYYRPICSPLLLERLIME